MERTITVAATGTIGAPPDQARISSGVVSEAATARQALTANSEAMSKVIATLKASGIDAKDIQTAQFRVDPVTDYNREGAPPRITGYRVSNEVGVLVRDLARLGDIMDELVSSGANQINGLTFEASKADQLKDEARKSAMAAALRRAQLLASAGGAEVGKVLQISEDVVHHGGPIVRGRIASMSAEAVPVESGEVSLEARVTVTWALK